EDVVVSLWGTGMLGVPFAVALDKGFFAKAGVTGAVGGEGGGNVVRNVLANALPYGEIATQALIAAAKDGIPLVAVNTGASTADNQWVTMPDSPIHTVKDLVGKRAAFTTPKSTSQSFLLAALQKAGVDAKSVTLIPAGGVGQG